MLLYSRLVRQDNVKEDHNRASGTVNIDQRSPNKRTFVDAKQTFYDDSPVCYVPEQMYVVDPIYAENSFLEADEDESNFDAMPDNSSTTYGVNDPQMRYDDGMEPVMHANSHTARSAENFPNEPMAEYGYADENVRYSRREKPFRRRRSREMAENEVLLSSNDDEPKWKPEAMRSVSEDGPTRNIKPVTRRSLSHPEKDTQVCNLTEHIKKLMIIHLTYIFMINLLQIIKRIEPQHKFLNSKPPTDVIERSRPKSKLPSPRRPKYKSFDVSDTCPTGNQHILMMQKRDSRSFDAVTMLKNRSDENDPSTDDGVAGDGGSSYGPGHGDGVKKNDADQELDGNDNQSTRDSIKVNGRNEVQIAQINILSKFFKHLIHDLCLIWTAFKCTL